jgi:misacylated tRNA(Ala) deacylase
VTDRPYLADPYLQELEAVVLACADGWCALSRTIFFPGGGGQPHDRGTLSTREAELPVSSVRQDEARQIWHRVEGPLEPGETVRCRIDWPYRYSLMRHHALLHVVNTVARDRLGGLITGAQIGPERSRIDLKLDGFSRDEAPRLEEEVNRVISRDLAISARIIDETEFRARPELIRTAEVTPPMVDGRVRIVEIVGFDAQACGGTHVHTTGEIGSARIAKFDNKGKDHKRFYWELSS